MKREKSDGGSRTARIPVLYLSFSIALIIGCRGGKTVDPAEYVRYFESNKNKYCYRTTYKEQQIAVLYKPNEYIVAQELLRDRGKNIQTLKAEYGNTLLLDIGTWPLKPNADGWSSGGKTAQNDLLSGNIFLVNAGNDSIKAVEVLPTALGTPNGEENYLIAFNRKEVGNPKEYVLFLGFTDRQGKITETIRIPFAQLKEASIHLRGFDS